MPSLKTTILAAATMLLSAVRADYVIDPSSVSMTLRGTSGVPYAHVPHFRVLT